jgi:predicted DNA-binding transcriptional regulator AlpA
VMLDALSEVDGKLRAGRAFVYQRNAERMCPEPGRLDEELQRFLQTEIEAVFPQLATPKDDANEGEPD